MIIQTVTSHTPFAFSASRKPHLPRGRN